MHIGFVIWKFDYSGLKHIMWGAEKQLLQVALGLTRKGHNVSIFSSGIESNSRKNTISDNLVIYNLPTTSLPGISMLLFMIVLPIWIIRIHFQRRFDTIHLPLPDFFIVSVFIIRMLVHVPIVSRIAADELVLTYSHGPWSVIRSIIRSYILKSDGVQTLNPHAQALAIKAEIPRQHVFLIPNGTDIKLQKKDYNSLKKRIIYVGALRHYPRKRKIEQKNLLYLIDAFALLIEQNLKLKLSIVGEGNYRTYLEEYVKSKSLDRNISFEGYQRDVLPFLYSSDIFVNPSHYEGLPNTVIEAMEVGLYVLCSDIPEHRFLIGDDEFGGLFDISNPKSFVEKVQRFYLNPEVYIVKAEHARNRVHENFSIEDSVTLIENMLCKITGKFYNH
jgi:glycosyltransferase involved in cell wall biosynthesis